MNQSKTRTQRHQWPADICVKRKLSMRDTLIARPLHAFVMRYL
jgi:hypothetical protein